jgi:ssDNA-binding replication factor A large subunit
MNAGLTEGEIEEQIIKKAEDFQGFISKKGILFLLAKEMGLNIQSSENESEIYKEFEEEIDYDEFTIKISDVQDGMSNIVLIGRIQKKLGIKRFHRKDGSPGVVGPFILYDGSDSIKIVLWSDHVKIMESEYFRINELVRVIGAYSKKGMSGQLEVHSGKNGKIILAPKDVDLKKFPLIPGQNSEKISQLSSISDVTIQNVSKIEGFVKKIKGTITNIEEFKEIDLKSGEKSFLLKLIVSDDTSSIRLVLWDMRAIECLKIINEGDFVILSNVLIKTNTYTEQKEIRFTRYSTLEKI